MSPTQQPDTIYHDAVSVGGLAESPDPEAVRDIELTAADGSRTKQDDPFLVCFDPIYDAEK